jgi:hypothetical protein
MIISVPRVLRARRGGRTRRNTAQGEHHVISTGHGAHRCDIDVESRALISLDCTESVHGQDSCACATYPGTVADGLQASE